jgi:hypothetical protein
MLDSLVRVSRRVGKNHFGIITIVPQSNQTRRKGNWTEAAATQAFVPGQIHDAYQPSPQSSFHVTTSSLLTVELRSTLRPHP